MLLEGTGTVISSAWLKILLIVMLVGIFLVSTSGCQTWKTGSGRSGDDLKPPKIVKQIQYKMALLPTLGVVAASASVLCIFLGATKIGLAALAASIFGTWMSLTIASFGNVFAIAGMVAAIVLAGAMVYKVKKANIQMVSGIQAIKTIMPKEKVNELVSQYQDTDVSKEVARVKTKLKKSGRIV